MKAVATATIKKPRTLLYVDDDSEEEEIVVKKPRTLLYAADNTDDEEEEEEEKKPKKSKKPVEEEEKKKKKTTTQPKTKKAVTKEKKTKHVEEDEEEEDKQTKVRTEKVLGLEEAEKLLEILEIAFSHGVLKALQKNDKKRYAKLIALLELMTVAYSERTPVGRMLTYTSGNNIVVDNSAIDTITPGFAVIRDSPHVFKLDGYEKKVGLDVRVIFFDLGKEDQEMVLVELGKLGEPTKTLSDAQLLYGLIACQFLTRVQADHSDPCQKCVLHDEKLKETHWLASKEAKAKLGPVFVLKLRKKITAQNIAEELHKMSRRRKDIVSLMASIGKGDEEKDNKKEKKEKKAENPKKRKAPEPLEEEIKEVSLPAKKKPRTPTKPVEQSPKAPVIPKKAVVPKQIELEPGVVLKPLSTPIKNGEITLKSIERTVATDIGFQGIQTATQVRNKVSEQKLKLMALDKELDPRIRWFNEHCGVD